MSVPIILRIAGYAVWTEIRQTLSGHRLGLLIPTLWLVILVTLLGTLFGTILKGSLEGYRNYVPFLACGLIVWMFVASTLTGACSQAPKWGRILRHTRVPLAVVPASILLRQLVILAQNLLLALILELALTGTAPLRPVAFAAGLMLTVAIMFCLADIGAILSLRFRDLSQWVTGILQAAFFMTPLIWPDYFLGRYRFLNELNPFYHLVGLLRFPLLGVPTPPLTWGVGAGLLAAAAAVAWGLHRLARRATCYWL